MKKKNQVRAWVNDLNRPICYFNVFFILSMNYMFSDDISTKKGRTHFVDVYFSVKFTF